MYGSSPEEHPALHTRIERDSAPSATIRGSTSPRSTAQASGSRKNPVTLMRMVLKSATCSFGC